MYLKSHNVAASAEDEEKIMRMFKAKNGQISYEEFRSLLLYVSWATYRYVAARPPGQRHHSPTTTYHTLSHDTFRWT